MPEKPKSRAASQTDKIFINQNKRLITFEQLLLPVSQLLLKVINSFAKRQKGATK